MNINNKFRVVLKALVVFPLLIVLLTGQLPAADTGDNIVMKAMTDEMTRSKARLKMDGFDKPYYLDYTIIDHEMMSIEASFGGIRDKNKDHGRYLIVSVRVGDYSLDNTNFVSSDMNSFKGMKRIPVENDYDAIRQAIWLATDEAYKGSLNDLARKKAHMKNISHTEQVDSFTHEDKPLVLCLTDEVTKWNEEQWLQRSRDISKIFKKYPGINESNVMLTVASGKQYFISSEGAGIIQPGSIYVLRVTASAQARDGERLDDFVTFYGNKEKDLPKAEKMFDEVESMAQRLTMRQDSSSVIESYIGPVVFEGQAAGEFFRQLLGKNMCGVAAPLFEDGRTGQYFPKNISAFKNKIGQRILPSCVSVIADPLTERYDNQSLAGYYIIDDEGIAARKVQLVDKGVVKELMLSRSPLKGFKKSNGHGRSAFFEHPAARISNLFINVTDAKKQEPLKQQLIALCKQQNREYGILVTSLEQVDIPTGEEYDMSRFLNMAGMGGTLLSKPVGIFKVFTDGHTEPVKGVEFGQMTLNVMKDIVLATDGHYVHNFEDIAITPFMRGGGLPVSIVAPAVLVEELEVKNAESLKLKLPFIKHPYFE